MTTPQMVTTTELSKRSEAALRLPPLRWGFWVGGVAVAITLLVLWFAIARPVQVLPRMRDLPQFSFTDHQGRWVQPSDLAGRMVLLQISSVGCGQACAAIDAGMHNAYQTLQRDGMLGSRVQLLTISVDPADTPDRLAAHVQQLGVAAPEWRWLTGIPNEVKQFVGGEFGFYYTTAADGTLQIEQHVVLIDANGVVRAIYNEATFQPEILARDLALLEREQRESVGAQRAIYEAAHIFVCYPQ
jgi:protein SCO1/2